MYLVYTDETGTNFSDKMSSVLLYGGLVVHESKINTLELQLQQMIAKFLKLDDIRKVELHTSEIFHILFSDKIDCQSKKKAKDREYCEQLKELLKDTTKEDFITFSDELIQFLIKMNIPLIIAKIDKEDEIHNHHRLGKDVSCLAYSFKMFLNMLDRFLASKNEKGLLIADDFSNQINSKIRNLPLYERISDENLKDHKELIFLRVLHHSLSWKYNQPKHEDIAPLKYEFESKNMFLIDNINYTNSKDSILNQVTDFLLFIIRRVMEYQKNSPDNLNDNLLREKDIATSLKNSIIFSEGQKVIQIAELTTKEGKTDIVFTSSMFSSGIYKDGVCN